MTNQVLGRWGVILVEGEDAANFLHAQLSHGVKDLDEGKLRLAAFCTAKGRMLGSFFVLRRGLQVFLICPQGTIPALSKRLSMFILRSKCKARDFTGECTLRFVPQSGLGRDMAVRWADDHRLELTLRPLHGARPGLELRLDEARAEADGDYKADAQFEHALQGLGIPYIVPETVEMFIPQTVNLDLVGGVNFEKGCYPGQEIVARSHYLGKSKRRAFLAELPEAPALKAGLDVWLIGKDNEPVGNVITCTTLNSRTYLMVDCTLDEGLNTESRFEIRQDGHTWEFGLQRPPYDVQNKGNQFND